MSFSFGENGTPDIAPLSIQQNSLTGSHGLGEDSVSMADHPNIKCTELFPSPSSNKEQLDADYPLEGHSGASEVLPIPGDTINSA